MEQFPSRDREARVCIVQWHWGIRQTQGEGRSRNIPVSNASADTIAPALQNSPEKSKERTPNKREGVPESIKQACPYGEGAGSAAIAQQGKHRRWPAFSKQSNEVLQDRKSTRLNSSHLGISY